MFSNAYRLSVLLMTLCYCAVLLADDEFVRARQQLVDTIRADVQSFSLYLNKEALDDRVLEAMRTVPRHNFVPHRYIQNAYENRPLPIGHGQTISQPYIVAVMTDLIRPGPGHRVLEIGTGSGYQAAILSALVRDVFTIEIIEPLARQAQQRFEKPGYHNVHTRHGDGYYGWEEEAPFDSIIVTAAASHVPPPLIAQLKAGGRMIIPVGSRFFTQELVLIEKDQNGKLKTRQVLPVMFVPLTGGH